MNPHLDLSPYLHQLMPALMTCLVAKRMGVQPGEDHWGVRDQVCGCALATFFTLFGLSVHAVGMQPGEDHWGCGTRCVAVHSNLF